MSVRVRINRTKTSKTSIRKYTDIQADIKVYIQADIQADILADISTDSSAGVACPLSTDYVPTSICIV